MKFRRLIKLSSILIMTLLIALAGICNNTSAKTTSTKSYSLVVRSVEWLTKDVDDMTSLLQQNKLYASNSVYTFTYDCEDGGTSKRIYNKAIDIAYKKCTKNDVAYFYHTGHGLEGIFEGWGVTLKSTKISDTPISWYSYSDLLKKLGSVSCKHMVVIIHACESGAVKKAYDNLPSATKKKISLFWSSGKDQKSYKNNSFLYDVYTQTLFHQIGYFDNIVLCDANEDGLITVRELGNGINDYIDEVSNAQETPTQTPGYTSVTNKDTVIFSYKPLVIYTAEPWLKNTASKIIYVGDTLTLKAKYKSVKKTCKWSSSRTSVCKVSSKGKVTAKGEGLSYITAKYKSYEKKYKVIVLPKSLTLSITSLNLNVDESVPVKATVAGPSSKVTWKSKNKKIATVSSKGVIKGIKKGSTTITATANGITKNVKVTVTKKVDKEAEKNKIIDLHRKIIKAGGLYNYSEDLELSEYLYDIDSDSRIAYAMMDLNADGEDEIVITDQQYKGLIVDVYRWNGTKYVQINELSSIVRGYYELLDGNYIGLTGSSNALESNWEFFTLDKTFKLVYKECVYYDEYEDEDHPWFYVKGSNDFNKAISITENKAYSIINSYKTKSCTSILIK